MPKEVSQIWLWTSQNAFLTETDSETGVAWKDRYGMARAKRKKIHGNMEPYLRYKKLQRTGRLLKSLRVKTQRSTGMTSIVLSSNVPYARTQEEGGYSTPKTIRNRLYIKKGEVSTVTLGGKIHARQFMHPSKKVRMAVKKLVEKRIKKYGWV